MPLKSEEVFSKMEPILNEKGAEFVKKIGAIYAFEIKETKDSKPEVFTIDLKNGSGMIRHIFIYFRKNSQRPCGKARYYLRDL